MVPQEQVVRLAEILREAGAEVTLHWVPGGHELAPGVVSAAQGWLAQHVAAVSGAVARSKALWEATRAEP
jgi:predicted esterase